MDKKDLTLAEEVTNLKIKVSAIETILARIINDNRNNANLVLPSSEELDEIGMMSLFNNAGIVEKLY